MKPEGKICKTCNMLKPIIDFGKYKTAKTKSKQEMYVSRVV